MQAGGPGILTLIQVAFDLAEAGGRLVKGLLSPFGVVALFAGAVDEQPRDPDRFAALIATEPQGRSMVGVAVVGRAGAAVFQRNEGFLRHGRQRRLLRRLHGQRGHEMRLRLPIGEDVIVAQARPIRDHEQVAARQALLQVFEHVRRQRRLGRIARQRLVTHWDAALAGHVQAHLDLLLMDRARAITLADHLRPFVGAAEGHVLQVPVDLPRVDPIARQRLGHHSRLDLRQVRLDRVQRMAHAVVVEGLRRAVVDRMDVMLARPLLQLVQRLSIRRLQQMQHPKFGDLTVGHVLAPLHRAAFIHDLRDPQFPAHRQHNRERRRQRMRVHLQLDPFTRRLYPHELSIAANLDPV
ncbi:MAG: hypothetical protein NTU91_06640 [Chloroflexi bacterium]|nr:hypothetical protein [Chloroflexota bacterium]